VTVPPNLSPNALVKTLKRELLPQGKAAATRAGVPAPAGLGDAAGIPQLVVFAGMLGDAIQQPAGGRMWRLLYLDWSLQDWLLVEERGIVNQASITDPAISPITRDVIWVDEDASVGRGNRSQSSEGQFLTGDFTRAGDFEAPVGGGTMAGSTGVFCEARTPTCCRYPSRP
jgi:hypothetical protein